MEQTKEEQKDQKRQEEQEKVRSRHIGIEIGIGVAIVIVLVAVLGVRTFYPQPDYEDYCDYRGAPVKINETIPQDDCHIGIFSQNYSLTLHNE